MPDPSSTAGLTLCVPFGHTAAVGAPASSPMVDLSHKRASVSASAAPVLTADVSAGALDAAMDRLARGDDAAFDELYRLAAPRVRGFLLRLSGDPALTDDLLQEAFMRLHAARGGFELGAAAIPWILAIARNVFLDDARRSRVRRALAAASTDARGMDPPAPGETRGDDALAAREMLEIVRTTLAGMPVILREAFVLLRFEGLSVREAAQVLGATEGAVKIRAFRAYELLRAALAPELREGE